MAEIDDGHDPEAAQLGEGFIREAPVIAAGAEKGAVDRRAIAQEVDAQVLHQREVLPPALVEVAALHLVDPRPAVVDGRVAVLDAGAEHEVGDGGCPPGGAPTVGTPRPPAGFISPAAAAARNFCGRRAVRSGIRIEEVSMADRLHENEMEREALLAGSPMRPTGRADCT